MKTIQEVLQTQQAWSPTGGDRLYEDWQVVEMLKLYGEEVADACAAKAEDIAYPGTEVMVHKVVESVKQQIG